MTHQLPTPLLTLHDQLVLDFGPRLPYKEVCNAYTVPKMAMWLHTTDNIFETVQLRSAYMHKARLEGNLYFLADEEDIIQLDNQRQVGVCCDRKKIPILLPYRTASDKLIQTYAWVYVGRPDYWEDRIERSGTAHALLGGGRIGDNFQLASLVPDQDRLLNNRFCFDPPPYYTHPEGNVSPATAKYIGEKNRAEIERIMQPIRIQQQLDEQKQRRKEFIPKLMRIITRRE